VARHGSRKDARYRELAQEVCKIAKIAIDTDSTLGEIIRHLRDAQRTPFLTSNQKEACDILVEITTEIENKGNISEIEEKIKKFEDAIDFDVWD
jgi:hypothetical protein